MALRRTGAAIASLVVTLAALAWLGLDGSPQPERPKPVHGAHEIEGPIAFEPNRGRFEDDVRFAARGSGYALALTREGAIASVGSGLVSTRVVGAEPAARPHGEARQPGVVNWYAGKDRSKWRTGIPTFGAVRYPDVYPGTDLVYHGRGGALEYDFVVSPGADPGRIRLEVDPTPRLTRDGDLAMRVGGGELRQLRPVAYQRVAGRRVPVDARFEVSGNRVGFRVGDYDRARPLVIDPVIAFWTYTGGTGYDNVNAVAASGGSVYTAGGTNSPQFSGISTTNSAFTGMDAWVMKRNAGTSAPDWVTFLEGSDVDIASSLAVDPAGTLFAGGMTKSLGFPTTTGVFQADKSNGDDGWVARLSTTTGSLLASTFMGGSGPNDSVAGIDLDSAGVPYVAGATDSAGFATSSALDQTLAANDAFLAKLSADLTTKSWLTYVGTDGFDGSGVVAVGPDDKPVVAGSAGGANLTGGTANSSGQGYVLKFNTDGASTAWTRVIGGIDGTEQIRGIAADSQGSIAVAGSTNSTHGATMADPPPFGEAPAGFADPFIYEVDSAGTLKFQDVIGTSSNNESATAVAFEDVPNTTLDNVYLTGYTDGSGFPTKNAVVADAGGRDAFLVKYKPSTTTGVVVYSTYFGGNDDDDGYGVAADATGAYIGGETRSTDTLTLGAYASPFQSTHAGGVYDGFLAKVSPTPGVITGEPEEGSVVSSNVAEFFFGPTETGGTFECSLDSVTLSACNSPKVYSNLSEGPHTVRLQAFDAGGSSDGTVASRAWTVDTQPPSAFGLTAPAADAQTSSTVTFGWSAAADATTLVARYDVLIDEVKAGELAGGCSPCELAIQSIAKGAHTWRVVAFDVAGNTRQSEIRTFNVDGTPPLDFQLQSPANAALTGPRPQFTWDKTSDTGTGVSRYEVWVSGTKVGTVQAGSCGASTCSLTPSADLSDGAKTWVVRAFDALENMRESASRSFTADATAPTAPGLAAPGDGAEVTTATPALEWTGSTDATSGVAEYDVEIDGSALGLHLAPSARSHTPGALSEGVHQWKVIVRDQRGNESRSAARSFRIDLSDPVAQLTVSPNPALAGRAVTLDASTSSDAAGGRIARYEWDLNGDGTFELDGGGTPTISQTLSSAGTYPFGVRVTDTVGKTSTATRTLQVNAPPVPAGQLGVSVNRGAQYTRTTRVKVNLQFPAEATSVLLSNDGGFFTPTSLAPQPEVDWVLDSSGPERLPKTVYVRFLIGPFPSETFTDDIILDETPPVVNSANIAPAPAAASAGIAAARARTLTVRLKATDSNSGVDAVQITPVKSKPGRFLPYKTRIKFKSRTRKLFVRARDRAGNLSRWRKMR